MDRSFFSNTLLTNQQIACFYLGQEGFLFQYKNTTLLIDPYLSDYVDRNCCSEKIKWVRNYPPPVKAEELDFIDYVLCTHTHYDHMDPDTLSKLAKANPNAIFIVPDFAKELAASYGINPQNIIGAVNNTSISCKDCSVTAIASAHEELHMDENGNYKEVGYILSFEDLRLYHAGDCCLYEGLCESLMDVDILMVPINGRSFFKLQDDIIGNMTIEEVLVLAQKCKPDLLIPMHYDLYNINCVNPAHFVDSLYSSNPTQKFHMFVPGERFIYTK